MLSLLLCTPDDFEDNLVIYIAEYRIFESLSVAVLEICESTVMHFLPNAAQIGSSPQIDHLSELILLQSGIQIPLSQCLLVVTVQYHLNDFAS